MGKDNVGAIMGLTGLRDSHMRVLAYSGGFALTGVSFRTPFSSIRNNTQTAATNMTIKRMLENKNSFNLTFRMYGISSVPCKFSFRAGFSY